MKKTIDEYINRIRKLKIKDSYNKDEILTDDFLVERDGDIEIYYAPHNDYINKKAKIFIVGITPGFQQMSTAIAEARRCIAEDMSISEIQYLCKRAGRFSGSMRQNIILMLDEIGLNEKLDIKSCSELFEDKDFLMHTISLIPYPVFVKGKNYTGHSPKLVKNEMLMRYVRENFISDLMALDDYKNILVIPLGKAVEEVLSKLCDANILLREQILWGFPHPSGANGNRLKQFEENKSQMIKKIKRHQN